MYYMDIEFYYSFDKGGIYKNIAINILFNITFME